MSREVINNLPEMDEQKGSFVKSIIDYGSAWIPKMSSGIDVKKIADHDLLKINNELTSLFSSYVDKDGKKIEFNIRFPEIITVGSQSSGKSSIGNGILGMDLFPTGKGITTRTPIHIQMSNVANLSCTRFEFGDHKNGLWHADKVFEVDLEPTKQQILKIREEIKVQTINRAGPKLNISTTPIFIRISSPKIHDLTIVDLPGIATVANIEEEQPEDIEQQLKHMIETHIVSERAIILLIISATGDPEADIAMGYVKKFDKKGYRTVGVLTKVDLMNKDTDVGKFILGTVSQNMKFRYGYYAVRNRTPVEVESLTVSEGIDIEKKFFNNHNVYNKLDSNRLGIVSLIIGLKNILIEQIRLTIPTISKELKEMESNVHERLVVLGSAIPTEPDKQLPKLSEMIYDFCRKYKSCFAGDMDDIVGNIGSKMLEIFNLFKKEIDLADPFNEKFYSNEYIQNIIKNCQGDHMSSPIPPINVLERCIRDPIKKPIFELLSPSEVCLQNIQKLVTDVINTFTSSEEYIRFPRFISCLKDEIILKLLPRLYENTLQFINILISSENNYQWTDDKKFNDLLSGDKKYDIRTLLNAYYLTVKDNIKNNIPKFIKYTFIEESRKQMCKLLVESLTKQHSISSLLIENPEQIQVRKVLEAQYERITSAKRLLQL